ncbi:MAG TPA: RluA family pseudouridine synthase [Candidatus Binatia bacterium]|nr:RluA family pseudouridine synthase [Candidatus Binatia bacterium]
MREIVLPQEEAPKTVEDCLKKKFPIGYVRKVFRKNGIRINGRRAKPDDLVRGGDRIQLFIPFERTPARNGGRAADKLAIVFEDDSLVVVNKPAGIAVHEGKTVAKRESLLGLLEAAYRGRGVKPQLVHRLDQDTSGLLLVAKDERTADELKKAFASRAVEKEYLCLVVGRLTENAGAIDFPLPGREGRPVRALTRYRVVRRFSQTTLVRVAIETGRLHQIRLHFARLGHPVVMDDQHGDFGFNKRFRKKYGLKRQFLHAEKLKLHCAGRTRQWTGPLPEDLEATLRRLAAET